MAKFTATPPTQVPERRSGEDRRRLDGRPPGKHERRRGLEPRGPEVVELEMSSSEWMTLSDAPDAPPKGPSRP
ncbi:MAG: hypothetical protein ACSLE9_20175 [Burkholderiaceae bacterium]